jgi:hypothetical protein
MRFEKGFAFSGRRAAASLELFNLFNNSAVTSKVTRSSATYGQPTAVVSPRAMRLGFNFKW